MLLGLPLPNIKCPKHTLLLVITYNELNKVNKKVNDMERMIRELKESNERIMRTMSEQFAQLAMSNGEKGTFSSQPEANPRGGSSLLST